MERIRRSLWAWSRYQAIMALPLSENEGSGGWWSSLVTAAKEKSVLALSATRRDLAEFVSVLQSDTTTAVTSATSNLKGLLQPTPEQLSDTKSQTKATSSLAIETRDPSLPYDRSHTKLLAVQTNPDTYLSDPKESEEFSEWRRTFDIHQHQADVSHLLVSSSHVRTLHARLVPTEVSYEFFWLRYFFQIYLLKQEEERRAVLMARATSKQEHLQWDEENDAVLHRSVPDHRSESSESFVCVTEETCSEKPPAPAETSQQGSLPDSEEWETLREKSESSNGSNSDWEKWDD